MPQNLPALTAQVGAADGTAIEVVGVAEVATDAGFEVGDVADVATDDALEVGDVADVATDDALEVADVADVATDDACEVADVAEEDPMAGDFAVVGGVVPLPGRPAAPVPGVRYQLASGSKRQVPAVTPFQPLARIRSK